jgi:peptide/nickel transport system substrate-binding protein
MVNMDRKSNLLKLFMSLVILLSVGVTACQPQLPGGGPTAEPTSSIPTEFKPMRVAAENCDYGGEIKSIEAIDRYTVQFTLCRKDPAFLSKVSFGSFAIQDQDFLDANQGSSLAMTEKTNGTGPYYVKEYRRGEQLILEVNPNYWGVPPKAKTIVFRWSQEPGARLVQLQSRSIDGIDNPSPDDYPQIASDAGLKLYNRQALNVFYLGMNNNIPPFNKEQVRQAFAQAINRQRIVENFYPAGSLVAEQFVPPAIAPGYTDNLGWYAFDPAQARLLLETANFDFNQEITLSLRDVSRTYLPLPRQVAQEIQSELADIGVKIKINVLESAAFLDSVAAGNEGLFMLGWTADYPDATNFYDFHFTGASKNFGDPYADLETAIANAGGTTDENARNNFYSQVNELIKTHVPMIPIAHGASSAAFKVTIQNVNIGPLNENFEEMSSPNDQVIFTQSGEPISLWPADETDGETFRPTLLIYSTLARFKPGGVEVIPDLAEKWDHSEDLLTWTFYLRREVRFTNGASLDANDVVATFAAQWDAKSPNHTGNSGVFEYFSAFFGEFLNRE